MVVQFALFAMVLVTLLALLPNTAAQVRVEDLQRQRAETPEQARLRHRLEKGFVSLFWIGVVGLWLVAVTGFVGGFFD